MRCRHPAVLALKGWNVHPYLTIEEDIKLSFVLVTEHLPDCLGKWVGPKCEGLTPTQKMIILYGLAAGMREVHGLGIVHRDLKPDNILLRSNGEPVICDLGLAKQMDDDLDNTDCGTPYYKAPECVDGTYTLAIDVYACGIIFGEVITNTNWCGELSKAAAGRWEVKARRIQTALSAKLGSLTELVTTMWSPVPCERPSFVEVAQRLADPKYWLPGTDEGMFRAYQQHVDVPETQDDPVTRDAAAVLAKASHMEQYLGPITDQIEEAEDSYSRCAYFLGAAAQSGNADWAQRILDNWKRQAGDPPNHRDDIALETEAFAQPPMSRLLPDGEAPDEGTSAHVDHKDDANASERAAIGDEELRDDATRPSSTIPDADDMSSPGVSPELKNENEQVGVSDLGLLISDSSLSLDHAGEVDESAR
jgi:serine/threonine protein kinase